MFSVPELLDRWPSLNTFAADLAVKADTAKKWKQRGRIPAAYWTALTTAAVARGIPLTTDVLALMHQRPHRSQFSNHISPLTRRVGAL